MAGESCLTTLLHSMNPTLNEGDYVFCSLNDEYQLGDVKPLGRFHEREGLSVIIQRQQAEHLGLACSPSFAWITLQVHSALDAVGLTAAVATALSGAGISCNVVAGYYHNHIFVAKADADAAIEALRLLASTAGESPCGTAT
ncbi:ACT domain-containing protein [Pseudomonas borbori]